MSIVKKRRFVIGSILSAMILGGCGSTLKYYEDANTNVFNSQVGLAIFSEAVPPTPQASTQLRSLPGEALAEYIKKYDGDAAKLASDLATVITRPGNAPVIAVDRSRTQTRTRLNLTVFTEQFKPADRLIEAKAIITPPEDWEFASWDGATIEKNTTRLATIVDQLNSSTATTLPFGLGSVPFLGGTAQTTNTTARNEQVTQNIEVEVVEFLPSITPSKATLRFNAPFPQINAAGTYSINFNLRAKKQYSVYLHAFSNEGDTPSIGLTRSFFRGVLSGDVDKNLSDSDEITGNLSYIKREVRNGAITVKESDDDVAFVTEQNLNESTKIAMLKASAKLEDLERGLVFWSVEYRDAQNKSKPVRITTRRHNNRDLPAIGQICSFFGDTRQAEAFADWLSLQVNAGKKNAAGEVSHMNKNNEFIVEAQKGDTLPASFNIVYRKITRLSEIDYGQGLTIIRPTEPALETCPVSKL